MTTGDRKTYKTVSVKGKEVEAVIDSGGDLHLMRSSCYVRFGAPPLRDNSISFCALGAFESRTLGSFDSHVIIDKMPIEIQIHVIPDHVIDHDLLIRGELSYLVGVRLKRRQVTIKTKLNKLIEGYKPNKTKDCGVKMRIILKDCIPVYQTPRQLASVVNEKVNDVIKVWLNKKIIK